MDDDDRIYLSDASEPEPIQVKRQKPQKISKGPHKRRAVDRILNMYKEELRLNFKSKNYDNISMNELIRSANQSFLMQNYENVIATSMELIRIAPNNTESYNLLYLVYDEMGDAKKSTDFLFVKTKIEKSTSTSTWYNLYEKYMDLQELESAYYCLSRALKFEPTNKQLLLCKAQLLERLNDSKRAVRYYEKLIKLDPFDFAIIRRVGKIYILQNKLKEALAILLRYIGNHQFIENIDLNIFFIALDLANKLKMYKYTIVLLESFILSFNKYTLLIQKMLKSFDQSSNLEVEALDHYVVNQPDKSKSLFSILKNYPLEITYQYFKALILTESKTALEVLDLLSLEKAVTCEEIIIDLIGVLIETQHFELAHKKTESIMLFNINDTLKLAVMKYQTRIYNKLGLYKNEIRVCKQIIELNPTAYKYKLRLNRLLNRGYRARKEKKVAEQDEIFHSSDDDGAIDRLDRQELVEYNPSMSLYVERTLDKHIDSETFKLKMYNPKLLDSILHFVNEINKNYPKELYDLLYEKAKTTDASDKEVYAMRWFEIALKAIELETKRKKFIGFLTELFSKESLKELIRMYKYTTEDKKAPLIFSRTNKIKKARKSDKKVYFIHKVINHYKGMIFSLISSISFDKFDQLCDKIFGLMIEAGNYTKLNTFYIYLFELKHIWKAHPQFYVKSSFNWYSVIYELKDYDLAIFCLKRLLGFLINQIEDNENCQSAYLLEKVLDLLSVTCMNINFFIDRITIDRNVVYSHLHKLLKNVAKKLVKAKNSADSHDIYRIKHLCLLINLLRGNLYFLNATYELALRFYDNSRGVDENSVKLPAFMSVLCNLNLTISRKNPDPRTTFQKALNFFNEYSRSEDKYLMYYNLHRLLLQVGAYDKVEKVFETAIKGHDQVSAQHQTRIFYQLVTNTILMYSKIKSETMVDDVADRFINN